MRAEGGFIADHLRELETDLLQPAIRKSLEALLLLLAEEFCEVGSSGLVYTRREAMDGLAAETLLAPASRL